MEGRSLRLAKEGERCTPRQRRESVVWSCGMGVSGVGRGGRGGAPRSVSIGGLGGF